MNVALILAGGCGTRLGASIPKQYIEVKNKPIIAYTLRPFLEYQGIDKIQIVADPEWHKRIEPWCGNKLMGFSAPGKTRQYSILNGLQDIVHYADRDDTIIIHDAARPCVKAELLKACIDGLQGHDGVLPVLPVKDTIYVGQNMKIQALLNRNQLFAGQAPEAFKLGKYLEANLALLPDRIKTINGSAEPAFLHGMDVIMIPGDAENFKVTTKADLDNFQQAVK